MLVEFFRLVCREPPSEAQLCNFLFNLPAVLLFEKQNRVVG